MGGVAGIDVGDAISGSLTYNDMPSTTNNNVDSSTYVFSSGFAVSVQIETHLFNSDAASPFNIITVLNNSNFDGDAFEVNAEFALLPIVVSPTGQKAIRIKLQDSTETVFSDTSLPLSLNLSSFDNAGGSIFSADGSSNFYSIGFSIDTLTLVPEPATMTLLALGGLALLGRRRRSA